MIAAPQHEVKTAAEVIEGDVICQSFIQSSSTLAYACLLIRRRRFELAAHVLHSLEARQASRFKDMVFYLQAQIGIETGEYGMVKKRLLPRVSRQPNDMVALSLLEYCIFREFAEREGSAEGAPDGLPGEAASFGNAEAREAAAIAESFAATELPAPDSAVSPRDGAAGMASQAYPTRPGGVPTVPPAGPNAPAYEAAASAPLRPEPPAQPETAARRPAPLPGREPSSVLRAAASGDAEMGLFQSIAQDSNTQAMGVWNAQGKGRIFCRTAGMESLVALLPRELPASLNDACRALDSGAIHKICFSFQHLTATTFHAGSDGMALITGPLNQSLLVIVRAENTFRKFASSSAGSGAAQAGGGSASSGAPA